jgi:hypothetical protein
MKIITTDLLFSYWIFAWAILYFMNIVTIAPKFLIIIALFEVVYALYVAFTKSYPIYSTIRLIFINFWIKIFPLYFLFDVSITYTELVYSFLLFIVYLLWLYANNQTFYNVYNTIIHVKKYKDTTTFARIYDTVYNYISKLMNQML